MPSQWRLILSGSRYPIAMSLVAAWIFMAGGATYRQSMRLLSSHSFGSSAHSNMLVDPYSTT